MERSAWLMEKRRSTEAQDTLLAPTYDVQWGEIAPLHQQFCNRFLGLCPLRGHLLDAPCGTGKYWPLVLNSGRRVLGLDQSPGMLARAREKFPDIPCEVMGLQEMNFQGVFDGAMCVDALEMVPPEDWPIVLGNFYRAIRPRTYFYFTVEIATEREVRDAFVEGQRLGLPVVYGEAEWLDEGGYHWERGGCYHYYPEIARVGKWIAQAGFELAEEQFDNDYHHFLVRKHGND